MVASVVADLVQTLGYPGLVVLMALEHLFPPIPSELILPLAGFEVGRGKLDFALTLASATAGSLAGASLLYALARRGGRPLVLRWRAVLGVDEDTLGRAEQRFERHSAWVVMAGRLVPGVRSLVSLPPGLLRMPFGRYLALTLVGSLVWNAVLIVAGQQLGSRWRDVGDVLEPVAQVVLAALLPALAVWLVVRRVRRRRPAVGTAHGALAGGAIGSGGQLRAARAWSTMKLPVVVAAIDAGRADPDDVEAAITRSDNDAALRLWQALGDDRAERVEAVLRRAGDAETIVEREPDPRGWSPFGRTVWTLEAAVGFYRALANGELLEPRETERLLDAMARVVPDQRWGLGALEGVRFKGGWGPSEPPRTGYEVIQVGIVDGRVLAVAACAADFEAAKELASKHVPQHPNAP